MFAGGLAGVICCMVALLVLPRIFEKQKKASGKTGRGNMRKERER